MNNKMSAKEQDVFGIMETKVKVVDLLIELSNENGYLTTETLIGIKTELLERHNKELMLERLGNE